MFLNILTDSSSVRDNSNPKSIYSKLQIYFGRWSQSHSDSREEMLSTRASTVTSDDSFITPVSSEGDLMALSPKTRDAVEQSDFNDLLTGPESDSICDVTMREVPTYNDLFIDQTSIDYLFKCAGPNQNSIDRTKESLYVKFDPLYARKMEQYNLTQTESVTDSIEGDGGYETGSTVSMLTDVTPLKHTVSAGSIPTNSKDRPMQVVPPVVNSEAIKCSVSQTRSTPALVRSVSAILAPTQVATDKLISIADSTPPRAAPRSPRYSAYSSQEMDRLQSLRVILQKQDQEVLTLRQENRELKSLLQDDQHKHSRRLEDLECQVKKLTEDKEHLLEREVKLFQQINEKILSNKQMGIVMEEYEKTISSLIGEQQREKIEIQVTLEKLTHEKDQALNHLSSMETSFNDLLSKYERCKTVIMETKEREKVYEQKLSEFEAGIKKYESLYENLKEITSESLAKANETLENLKKSHSVEITKLNATIKKHEITIASLQESVVQKTRDNEELTRICDQLINEVR